MLPDEHDAGYLWDMLDAAWAAQEFIREIDFAGYMQDRKVQFAVERAIEIVGEAARGVSDTFRQAHPEIPWRSIIGQRNVLAHDYGQIRHDRVWEVVAVHLPALITLLEPLIPAPPAEEGSA
jgi:uncharacterized protein with HEPN domain